MSNENTEAIELESVNDIRGNTPEVDDSKSKKKGRLKFLAYFLIIMVLTGLALFFSLKDDLDGIIKALSHADYKWILVIAGLVIFAYMIDGFTIFVFSRLYTRKYKYHQGFATSIIGAFYSGITPGASGGQIMQVYTMKKQGVEPSSAASIMVMSFIVYQICLIIIGAVGIIFNGDLIASVGTFNITIGENVIRISPIPLTIAGFLLNISVILLLFLMSYSHKFHNFILHYVIGFLGKIRILRKPDETRESLRIQVENFKIELRRLLSNIPIFILMIICFSLILMIRFSIPFFAGLALNGYGNCVNPDGSLVIQHVMVDGVGQYQIVQSLGQPDVASVFKGIFLSSYHQMMAGLIPIPGTAGISEYFFNIIFANYFVSQPVTTAAQIIWRVATYHFVLLLSGIVAATYRSSPKNEIHHANRKTFVTLQYETFNERKASSDTMFETSSLSRKEIQNRLRELKSKEKKPKPVKEKPVKEAKVVKEKAPKAKKKKEQVIDWDEIETGEE